LCSEAGIESMVRFLANKIYVVFGEQVFLQLVGISMGSDSVFLLTGYFYIHMKRNLFKQCYWTKAKNNNNNNNNNNDNEIE
jgi:hypothetical protein